MAGTQLPVRRCEFLMLVLYGILFLTTASRAADDSSCRTPGGDVGKCVSIRSCKSMMNFLKTLLKTRISERTKMFIRKFECGSDENGPKVCCCTAPIAAERAADDSTCTTPDGMLGKCVDVNSCEAMLDFLKQFKNAPLNAQVREFVQKFQCDFGATTTKVCCPFTPIVHEWSDEAQNCGKKKISTLCRTSVNGPDVPKSSETTKKLNAAMLLHHHRNAFLLPEDSCGVTKRVGRIANGETTRYYEFPWMAALKFATGDNTSFNCGGTLINKRYILTAAHCIRTRSLSLVGVRLGDHDLTKDKDCDDDMRGCAPPSEEFAVTADDAIVHGGFNKFTKTGDIALIRLRREANTSDSSVIPICLPLRTEARNERFERKYTTTGWGKTEKGNPSSVLLKVDLDVVPYEECSRNLSRNINMDQMCAGGGNSGKDSCMGDSGGPLTNWVNFSGIMRTVQYGVVSYGPTKCGAEGEPGVYTRVTSYLEWILDNLKP